MENFKPRTLPIVKDEIGDAWFQTSSIKCVYADKIVALDNHENGLYFGELDEENNRSGYGRTQTDYCQTIYEGEYSDDKKSGFGSGYNKIGRVSYVGNWSNDIPNGFGIIISQSDGIVTLGSFEDGEQISEIAKYDKNGTLIVDESAIEQEESNIITDTATGTTFVAKMENGKPTEYGTLIAEDGTLLYCGGYRNRLKEGRGTLYNSDGTILYTGTFKNNVYNGKGTLYFENGDVITGEFSSGYVHGKAEKRSKNNSLIYNGTWKYGVYNGAGIKYKNDGSYFEGEFIKGKTNGPFNLYDSTGSRIYKGTIEDGLQDGNGIIFDNGEKIYDGHLSAGKRNGAGKEYENGKLIYSGTFLHDKYDDFGISYTDGTESYIGSWKNGKYDGLGIRFEKGNTILVGNFANGLPEGRVNVVKNGVLVMECICTNGDCEYMREYSFDAQNLIYEGNVKDGIREGMGCTFSQYGEKIFEGIFKYGEPFKSMKTNTKKLPNLEYVPRLKDTDYEKYRLSKEYAVEQPLLGGIYTGTLVKGVPNGKGTILFSEHRYTGEFADGKAIGSGIIYFGNGTVLSGEFAPSLADNATKVIASEIEYFCIEE
ncbi:hypothetical protein AGMMS50284_6470 [Clostridia bacterium]|nr:hypothetical protein AGMMS50284_6470 [Clostridia bacterium]